MAGYARNYPFPRKLALAVTAENKRQIERERARADAHEAEERQEAEAIRTRVEALEVAIARRVGEQERCMDRSRRATWPRRSPIRASPSIGAASNWPTRSRRWATTRWP